MSVISDALRRARIEDGQRLRPADGGADILTDVNAARLTTNIGTQQQPVLARNLENSGRGWLILREAAAVVLAITSLAALATVGSVMSRRSAEPLTSEIVDAGGTLSETPDSELGSISSVHPDAPHANRANGVNGSPTSAVTGDAAPTTTRAQHGIAEQYRVSAVLRGNGTTCAVINGTVVRCGDAIDGATVRVIDGGGVALERDGVRFRLPVSKPAVTSSTNP